MSSRTLCPEGGGFSDLTSVGVTLYKGVETSP